MLEYVYLGAPRIADRLAGTTSDVFGYVSIITVCTIRY